MQEDKRETSEENLSRFGENGGEEMKKRWRKDHCATKGVQIAADPWWQT